MAETPLDFQCWLGSYEIWHKDKLPSGMEFGGLTPPNTPVLVQTGPVKLVRPKREALDYAVGLLLKTKMPKWHAEEKRRRQAYADLKAPVGDPALKKFFSSFEFELDREEFSNLERNVLAIAKHTGLLRSFTVDPEPNRTRFEALDRWIDFAERLQVMFSGREAHRELKQDLERSFGQLNIVLSFKSGVAAMYIRPQSVADALIYRAAQMIAEGTTLHSCAHCGTPFLGGGTAVGAKGKRGDARFCTDKCRSAFHNEARRKAMRKTKL
jgi:hypothetical protein